ncbi:TTLL9 polyglutamylase, partial [Acromyrmex heyeri]
MNNTQKIFEDSRISPLQIEITKCGAEKKICNLKKKQNSEDKVVKFRCDFPSTQVEVMLARGWTQIVDPEDTNWHLWWCDTGDVLRQVLDGDRKKLRPYQRVPHFRNHYELTRKNYLYRNLKRYRKALIRAGKFAEARISDLYRIKIMELENLNKMINDNCRQQGATWIVKPVARSRGKAPYILNSSNINISSLISGRKFDLRIYVLVTSFHPLKVWLAREGFARLCGQLFDLENIDDNRVHLTNTAIQLKASQNISSINGEKGEWSCKWALNKLRDYLIAYYKAEVVENLMQRIAGVIMASLLAVQPSMMQDRNCFELYGYDILLSDDLRPWLLEINASPALTGTDNEDQRLKSDLVDDVLNVLDFEGCFSGHETRIGGLDLLWDDGPVWTSCPYPGIHTDVISNDLRRLNIFLGAINDRQKQLSLLKSQLIEKRKAGQNYSPMLQYYLK